MTAIIFLPNHYSSITLPVLHGGLFPLCPLPSNLDRPFWLPSLIHCGRSNQYEFWVMSQKHTRFYLALSGCSFLEPCVHVVRKRKQPMKRLTWRGTRVPHLQPVWAFSEQPHRYASHVSKPSWKVDLPVSSWGAQAMLHGAEMRCPPEPYLNRRFVRKKKKKIVLVLRPSFQDSLLCGNW